jgi:polysaccharide biosynthesis protein PslH
MKILMVTPMPPSRQAPGAIPLVLHAQLTGLIERHNVTLITVAGPDPLELQAVDHLREKPVTVHAVRRSVAGGAERWKRRWQLASSWLQGKCPWRTLWFWEQGVQQLLDRLAVEEHFDIITVEDNAMGIYRYPTGIPHVITEVEVRRPRPVDWQGLGQPNRRQWLLREADWSRWPRYQRMVWQRFDRVQVYTQRDADSVAMIAPELAGRVRVNPFGIALPAAAEPQQEQENSLLFVGNFTHPPNVDAALWLGQEIMPLLRAQVPGVRLTLVGPYPPPAVQALAREDILVTGRVPEIEPFLEQATVVLAPIRTGGGMRMKVLQSMAFGKAVVTTPRGALGLEIAETRPPLAIAEEAPGLAAAVIALLQNPRQRQELARQARQFVIEHYSPTAYARRLETIYSEARLERAPHRSPTSRSLCARPGIKHN